MKTNTILISICLFLAFVTFKSYDLYLQEHATAKRLTANLTAVQQDNEYFKAKNGEQAVKITAQQLTIAELRATIPAAIADIKNLSIRPALVNTYTTATAQTENRIITPLKDSIVFDTVRVSRIDYFDKWIDITGTIRNDTAALAISTRDRLTLINYQSRRPRSFLGLFRYGRRVPETVIKNENPYSKIYIEKSITIKR